MKKAKIKKLAPGTPRVLFSFLSAYFCFLMTALGVTAGAHRLWSHRSYKAKLPLRIFLAVANSMAFQVGLWLPVLILCLQAALSPGWGSLQLTNIKSKNSSISRKTLADDARCWPRGCRDPPTTHTTSLNRQPRSNGYLRIKLNMPRSGVLLTQARPTHQRITETCVTANLVQICWHNQVSLSSQALRGFHMPRKESRRTLTPS